MPGNRLRNWHPYQERKRRKKSSNPAETGDKVGSQVATKFMKMEYNVEF